MFVPRTVALMFCIFSVMLSGIRCATSPAAPKHDDRATLLRGRTWTSESLTFNGAMVTSEGVRTLRLDANGTYLSTLHSGASLRGTWALSDDESQLVLDGGATEESVFDLLEVSTSRLRMTWTGERNEVVGTFVWTARPA